MPKIQRKDIPKALMAPILTRVVERGIGVAGLRQFDHWLAGNPEIPHGAWFKRFVDFVVCGKSPLVTTFLSRSQSATGEEVECSLLQTLASLILALFKAIIALEALINGTAPPSRDHRIHPPRR